MPYYLTLQSRLSVLRTSKPNWRSVQLNNCKTAIAGFHSAPLVSLCDARFHFRQSFYSHQNNCNRTFFCILSFLNSNLSNTKIEVFKSLKRLYFDGFFLQKKPLKTINRYFYNCVFLAFILQASVNLIKICFKLSTKTI